MKLIEIYLTKHHFTHTPHLWFFALLLSPIHAAEMRYKTRYHLTYVHAKKLFFFDVALLLILFSILGSTIYLFFYDPTVTRQVTVSINASSPRIISGDTVAYQIHYKNNSGIKLKDAKLQLSIPTVFVIDPAQSNFTATNTAYAIGDISGNGEGEATVTGRFFGTPNAAYRILANLTYTQEHKNSPEEKIAPIIITSRGTQLQLTVATSDTLINNSENSIAITLFNSGSTSLNHIQIPFPNSPNISFNHAIGSLGTISPNGWVIDELVPYTTTTVFANMNVHAMAKELPIDFSAYLFIENIHVLQNNISRTYPVLHPEISAAITWPTPTSFVQSEKTYTAFLDVTNTGQYQLRDLVVKIPLDKNLIDVKRISILNKAYTDDGILVIDYHAVPAIQQLPVGAHIQIPIYFPIHIQSASNRNAILRIVANISSKIQGINENVYTISVSGPETKVKTEVYMNAEARYYTGEGDQLGRGPLPPEVGKTTKYWFFVHLTNTVNRVDDLDLQVQLAPGASWTGKTSVSRGPDMVFDSGQHRASWKLPFLEDHDTVSIGFELAITPTYEQQGQNIDLVQTLTLRGVDLFTNQPIEIHSNSYNSSLPKDSIAQQKGVTIQ